MSALRWHLYGLRLWLSRVPERVAWAIAFALPKRIAYFAFIRVAARATQTNPLRDQHFPSIPAGDLLRAAHEEATR